MSFVKLRLKSIEDGNLVLGYIVLPIEQEDKLNFSKDEIRSRILLAFNEYEKPNPDILHHKGVFFYEHITLYTGEVFDIYRTV